MQIRLFIKRILPSFLRKKVIRLLSYLKTIHRNYFILTSKRVSQADIELFKKRNKVRIAFLVVHSSVWKYEILYKLIEFDDYFEPIIIICPYVLHGKEIMFNEMENAFNFFSEKGYNVTKSFDLSKNEWLKISKDYKPDIIFFTNPYDLTHKEYYIKKLKRYITCYVPYGYMITNRPKMQYDELLHNMVSRFYLESYYHKSQAEYYSRCKGINAVVTGYPGLDELLFPSKEDNFSAWKLGKNNRKKIIWAPHHTIISDGSNFIYSNFLEYSQIMCDLAVKYKDFIEISFKPHPILKANLYKHKDWGKEKTEKYYHLWDKSPNTQLNESGYIDLFLSSDAMIFDSGSFIIEYLAVNKPSLYQVCNSSILDGFSELGLKALNCHYRAYNKVELVDFIENVVISGNDILKSERETFVNDFLMPPNNKTASENIFDDLCKIVGKNLY